MGFWLLLSAACYFILYDLYVEKEQNIRQKYWSGKCNYFQTARLKSQGEGPIDYDAVGTIGNPQDQIVTVISQVSEWGCLPFDHWFRIGIDTSHPQLIIPSDLKVEYPEEIWIYLEYQFSELHINKLFNHSSIHVRLSFDGVESSVWIPIDSIFFFDDPSRDFSVDFKAKESF